MTAQLRPVAPVAMLLEGGYNLDATAACVEACIRALLGERPRHLANAK
jgi:acetoin utilization deacetylase AcuC-like enzyme